jgi:hypothetical protein
MKKSNRKQMTDAEIKSAFKALGLSNPQAREALKKLVPQAQKSHANFENWQQH